GDSIWFIASRLIRRELEVDLRTVAELREELKDTAISSSEKKVILDKLTEIAERTKSENLRKMITNQYLN
ncbi:MAG: hypothetical protein ACQEWA_06855, partial [Sphaerochaetaceae bacterium]|nr:hypothetical protein [Spirochaetales bacterium]